MISPTSLSREIQRGFLKETKKLNDIWQLQLNCLK